MYVYVGGFDDLRVYFFLKYLYNDVEIIHDL